MDSDFLLRDALARQLFNVVKGFPIIDWHNHLSIKDLSLDRQFGDLTELWIASDPYKHRAMRICGVPEKYITGSVPNFKKYEAWSWTLPQLVGNPLYDWSRLELHRIFGIEEDLTPATAEKIWRQANEQLSNPEFSACGLLKRFNVEYAAPCTQLGEPLQPFASLKSIVPSLRGDDILALTHPLFTEVRDLSELHSRLENEIGKLHAAGCRFADHALDNGFQYVQDDGKNGQRFEKFIQGHLPEKERCALSCYMLRFLASQYAKLGWTVQLHVGAQRKTSSRLRSQTGTAGGYASIGNSCNLSSLTSLLDDLECSDAGLPRVIFYTLNPTDHAMFAVLSGSFPGDGERGKVTLGPAWWYCDHIHGMKDCFENIAAYGVLSVFPGMTTDSRSLLSFVRHEYFRRVFCAWLAEKAAREEIPSDYSILKDIAEKVCYFNAKAMINQPKGEKWK
ncbi:MAG: glucuronate isomerase [Victivallales bacterium]|nr:glucuronate isomerase [Victivallales bacterium]